MAGEMGIYQPQNYTYGGGGPTQSMVGLGANLLGNALIPGLGLLTGPLGKWITQMIQQGGGLQDDMSGGQPGGGIPSPVTGGFRGPAIHYSAGGVPAPGGLSGIFGQGSYGDLGNMWSRIVDRAYNRGDPAMGLDAPGSAVPQYAATLQVNQGAFPTFSALKPYLNTNTSGNPSVIGGGADFLVGPTGKQMSAK